MSELGDVAGGCAGGCAGGWPDVVRGSLEVTQPPADQWATTAVCGASLPNVSTQTGAIIIHGARLTSKPTTVGTKKSPGRSSAGVWKSVLVQESGLPELFLAPLPPRSQCIIDPSCHTVQCIRLHRHAFCGHGVSGGPALCVAGPHRSQTQTQQPLVEAPTSCPEVQRRGCSSSRCGPLY